jgi:predicted phosphoribosyltransferase
MSRFRDRTDAAETLAAALVHRRGDYSVVYAIPHAGVVTGEIVATALRVPLRVATEAGCAAENEHLREIYEATHHAVPAETAVIVDEGMITGETMARAIAEVRKTDPQRIIVAVPAATARARQRVQSLADETLVLCELPDVVESLASCHETLEPVSRDVAVEIYRRQFIVG